VPLQSLKGAVMNTEQALNRAIALADEAIAAKKRIAELEALLKASRYILANNALEGDTQAGDLVTRINNVVKK
jgi:hypothetical protein